jgi:TetR/AcrR family transcriptional repressor of lmrAB and yxaGH operons
MEHGAGIFLATLAETLKSQGGTAKAIRHFAGRLAGWMEESRFRDGSPLTAVTVEMSGEAETVRRACAAGYAAWEAAFARALVAEGLEGARADALATWIVASMDGATVLARARADGRPIRVVLDQVAGAVEAALKTPSSRAR